MTDHLNKRNRDESKSEPEAGPTQLPLVPLRDMVLFPHMITPVFMGRARSIKALSRAMETDKRIFLATQNNPDTIKPMANDISPMGTQARITQMLRLPDGTVKALVEGECRGKLTRLMDGGDFVTAEFVVVHETPFDETSTKASVRTVVEAFEAYAKLAGNISKGLIQLLGTLADTPGKLADTIAAHMPFKVNDKRQLLNLSNVEERLFLLLKLIQEETEVFAMSQKIKGRVKEQMEKLQKKHYLNEQMTAIRREMGEDGEGSNEFKELETKIRRKRMPKEAAAAVRREFDKLVQMSPMSSEATVVRNYIDWIISLPWYRKSRREMNLADARQILDTDHYGLEKPKERILEYLAVQMLVKKIKGPILCLVGPPGVGKTSLARSIARSTGRSFARISLGGVRDEAEIRGHRRTYIGAMPGKIIQTLKKTGYSNPVFCLDEVDKMSTDFRGDPSSALLEVLDPEQNQSFNDHYLDVDYDLSDILFVTTANTLHNIPAPLRDRMEVIQIPGYTEYEKERIAHGFLVPKQLAANGLDGNDVVFSKQAILSVIRHYTREAGVRNLEREISSVCRKIVKKSIETKDREKRNLKDGQKDAQKDSQKDAQEKKQPQTLSVRSIHKHLGMPKFRDSMLEAKDQIGIVNGLAWTQAGGELLTIETVTMPGKGNVSVTGKLGDVMKESASAAVSYVRSRHKELHIPDDFYRKLDIHIHVPEGAIPKDGPSAGIAMCTALVSALTGRPVDRKTAMTGEITLRGRVLPVGGLKEKLIAAHAAGITRVIISQENKRDIAEIPASIQRKLSICLVEEMGEVIELALLESDLEERNEKKDA